MVKLTARKNVEPKWKSALRVKLTDIEEPLSKTEFRKMMRSEDLKELYFDAGGCEDDEYEDYMDIFDDSTMTGTCCSR